MNTIKAIRIEHPEDGYGLFRTQAIDVDDFAPPIFERHSTNNPDGMPAPGAEGLSLIKGGFTWFCAYTLRSFNKWLYEDEIKTLIKNGFRVYEIEAEVYQKGKEQILYTNDGLINKMDISQKYIDN